MNNVVVKNIIKNSFKEYLKELDEIKLEVARCAFAMSKNLTGKQDEQSRKSKSE